MASSPFFFQLSLFEEWRNNKELTLYRRHSGATAANPFEFNASEGDKLVYAMASLSPPKGIGTSPSHTEPLDQFQMLLFLFSDDGFYPLTLIRKSRYVLDLNCAFLRSSISSKVMTWVSNVALLPRSAASAYDF